MSDGPRKNIYLRGKTYWGRIMVARQEIRWSLHTSDAAVAARRAKERLDAETAKAHFGEHRKTYADVFVAWSEHMVNQVRPATLQRYAVSLGRLEPFLKPRFLDEIDRALVSEIVKGRRAGGATNATIRRDLTALSSVMDFAEGEEWRSDNPVTSFFKRVKEKRDPITPPNSADIERVIARAPGMFADLIRAARLTGCREEELAGCERRQIDHARRQLNLYKTKTNRPRSIDLSPEAYELFRAAPARLGCKWVFWHSEGARYRNVSSRYREIVMSAQRSAQSEGVEFRPFRFHDLRHLYAINDLKNGGNIYALQKHLGHSSIKTTEIYLDYLTPEEAMRAKFGNTNPGTARTVVL